MVRSDLADVLLNDAALEGLVGSRIYFQVAPQNATFPLVVFQRQSGTPRWTMGGDPVQDDLWAVKAVTTGSGSASSAEAIVEAIDSAVTDAFGLYLRRESDIDYAEQDGATTYRHLGATYRVVTA